VNLLRSNEKKLYQKQNKLKKSENFHDVGVYYSVEHHGANEISVSFYN